MKKDTRTGGHGMPTGAHRAEGEYSGTSPQPSATEGLFVASGTVSLTDNQLEFMERLSEYPSWPALGRNDWMVLSDYIDQLLDTMTPMVVGATVTTLKKKGLIRTKHKSVQGVRSCVFQLTDLGVEIYKELAGDRL